MPVDPRKLPFLGAGVGYRSELSAFLADHRHDLGFLELMPEHVLDVSAEDGEAVLAEALQFPIVTHSVSISIGSAEGPDRAFLQGMRRVSDLTDAPWASDHLCFTQTGGHHLGQLVPLPYTDESLDVVIQNVKTAQRILGRPFALENVTKYFAYSGEDYTEPEFLSRICEATDALILLDVTNVHNNATNLGIPSDRYLRSFPLDRVIHLHLGGVHEDGEGGILDTHAGPVPEPVWEMTERVLEEAPVRALLIERDDDFDLPQLSGELARAARMMRKVAA